VTHHYWYWTALSSRREERGRRAVNIPPEKSLLGYQRYEAVRFEKGKKTLRLTSGNDRRDGKEEEGKRPPGLRKEGKEIFSLKEKSPVPSRRGKESAATNFQLTPL